MAAPAETRQHPYAPTSAVSIAGTISNVVCSSALCFTMAPTEQYFSSDSRMASSTAWGETSRTAHDVVNAHLSEDLWRIGRLVGFHSDFVAGNLLTLLAQDADDVERRTARQGDGDQFDGFCPGIAGGVVNQEVVSGTAGGYELAMSAEGLGQSYAGRDHVVLR